MEDYPEPEELLSAAQEVLRYYRGSESIAEDLARMVIRYFCEGP